MRAIITAVLLSMLAGAAASAQSADPNKPARTQPSQTNGMAARPETPVGNRQPTEGGLPPSVRQNEESRGSGRGAADPLGPLPRICRDC
jgi:hypothetical protein